MSSATSDSTKSTHAIQPGRSGSSEDSFAVFVKPFDSVESKLILALNPPPSIMTWVPPQLVWGATYGVDTDHAISTLSTYSSYPHHLTTRRCSSSSEISRPLLLTVRFADDGDLPGSRAYPKFLDIASPTVNRTNKNADTTGPGGDDEDDQRPWPKLDKHQSGSKRKRETIEPDLPWPSAHHQDDRPLQRWLRESPAQEPYHGIADAEEDLCQARSTKGNNTKQHRS